MAQKKQPAKWVVLDRGFEPAEEFDNEADAVSWITDVIHEYEVLYIARLTSKWEMQPPKKTVF